MSNSQININSVVSVFKKIARKTGWKVSKNYSSYELQTDLAIKVENKTYYINIIVHHWDSSEDTWFTWHFANAPLSHLGSSRLRYKGKLVKQWDFPCDFTDMAKADEYIETLKKFVTKKNANFNKNENKTKTNFDEQRIIYKSFYDIMEYLATKNNVNFTEDKNEMKKWEFADVTISWSNKEKCWRVVIGGLSYSYFRCKSLECVVDLVKWYMAFPSGAAQFSFKF